MAPKRALAPSIAAPTVQRGKEIISLVVLGGTGDAYLICALASAFRGHHDREVEVVLHPKLAAVAELFDVQYRIDEGTVRRAEDNQAFQRSYDNVLLGNGAFYTHPCFARSQIRVDALTAKSGVSQADMYRMMLQLPPDAPMAKPKLPPTAAAPGTVFILTESVSWPNTQRLFWERLGAALLGAGRRVTFNDKAWSLTELFRRCAASEWVIGPQCGVMSILVTGEFPCRKTLATPDVDGSRRDDFWARDTYPYGYVTKFAGDDHDVEEYKVSSDNHHEIIRTILQGPNALRLWPHDPRPVTTVTMPLTPGDLFDRLAVLTVKRRRFDAPRRAAVEREYQRYAEAARPLLTRDPDLARQFADLVALHLQTFDRLEVEVPAALANPGRDDHWAAVFNRDRVGMRNEIDERTRAPYRETKSYNDAN